MLEVNMHPEGPPTKQRNQVYPRFSSALGQVPIWYSNSASHCKFLMQTSQY